MEELRYTKQQIRNIAEGVLERYGYDTFPLEVVELAEAIGLKVYDATFGRDDVSGMLKAQERAIYICQNDSNVRQRFSIAHELGHYVLHFRGNVFEGRDKVEHTSYRDTLSSLGFSVKEVEANYFAANLLMPKKEVERLYRQNYKIGRAHV